MHKFSTKINNMLTKFILTATAAPVDTTKVLITDQIKHLSTLPGEELADMALHVVIQFGLKVLSAILIYIIGAWIIRRIKKIVEKIFKKKDIDASLSGFIGSIISITLNIILIITIIGILGINTTSFAAILAAGGLAIGMALSGCLQNFASGLMILLFKPFKVGDFIDGGGHSGTVNEISINTTILLTPDNKTVIIPNKDLSDSSIQNYSKTEIRRVDWEFGLEYGSDPKMVREQLCELFNNDKRILKAPAAPFVAISALDDSAVKYVARVWVKSSDYWDVLFEVNEKVYTEFPTKGMNFPFPQLNVTLNK